MPYILFSLIYIVPLANETSVPDVLELYYPQFSVGAVNTSMGWTYSNLTCHPSVFTIEGYAAIPPDQLATPTLTLNSTSSGLTFPTNMTNGSLYWRLLAHEGAGRPCDTVNVYYQLNASGKPMKKSMVEL